MRKFNRSLPIVLLRAREAVMKEFIPYLREHNISPQQWRVLRVLFEHNGIDISEIAERCCLLKPSLSRILQNLESRGFISRDRTVDQRRSIISLKDKGRQLIGLIAPKSEKRYRYITRKFGYGKLQLLYELLDELIEKLMSADKH